MKFEEMKMLKGISFLLRDSIWGNSSRLCEKLVFRRQVSESFQAPVRCNSKDVESEGAALISTKIDVPQTFDTVKYKKSLAPALNLAAYADEVPVLQQLIKLGVEIYKFDPYPELCEFILKLNFDRDVKPYLQFLFNNGVPAESLGKFITTNPNILQCDLEDLSVRINYLESKNFKKEMISEIITRNPKWLSIQVKDIDRRLGYLQKSLKLTGDQVRAMVTKCPAIGTLKKDRLMVNLFVLEQEMNLEKHELRSVLLKVPKLLKKDDQDLINTFHYLLKNMAVPVHLIIQQPEILDTRVHILATRHKFLTKLGRAQYNPEMPGYVSLLKLVRCDDETFCKEVALASIKTYDEFLKTL